MYGNRITFLTRKPNRSNLQVQGPKVETGFEWSDCSFHNALKFWWFFKLPNVVSGSQILKLITYTFVKTILQYEKTQEGFSVWMCFVWLTAFMCYLLWCLVLCGICWTYFWVMPKYWGVPPNSMSILFLDGETIKENGLEKEQEKKRKKNCIIFTCV